MPNSSSSSSSEIYLFDTVISAANKYVNILELDKTYKDTEILNSIKITLHTCEIFVDLSYAEDKKIIKDCYKDAITSLKQLKENCKEHSSNLYISRLTQLYDIIFEEMKSVYDSV